MARASTPTFLSLDRASQILGMSPAHFNSAIAGDTIWQSCGECRDTWYQFAYQATTGLSREYFAQKIMEAETELTRMLGKPICPTLKKKVLPYQEFSPQLLAKQYLDYYPRLGAGWRSRFNTCCLPMGCRIGSPSYYIGKHLSSFKTKKWAQLEAPSIDDENMVYYDRDADGFAESGEVTFSVDHEVAPKDIGIFYPDHFGEPEWRIRPVNKITVDFNEETELYDVTIKINTWQLIDPMWTDAPPRTSSTNPVVVGNMKGCALMALDMSNPDILLASLVIGEEVEDLAWSPVKFTFEKRTGCGNTDCAVCNTDTFTGCLVELTRSEGFVVPIPATYDTEKGWCATNVFGCCGRTPGTVEISYWDGLDDYVQTATSGIEPPAVLSEIVAMLAMSRTQITNCLCDCNSGQWWKELALDLAITTGAGRYIDYGSLANPFGTRRGELQGWQRWQSYTYGKAFLSHGAA